MIRKLISMVLIASATALVAQTADNQKPQTEHSGALRLEHADVPLYPQMARLGRIFGTIEVQVTVKDGEVVNAEVKSPKRGVGAILDRAAVENIRTWRFYKLDSGTFTTKFVYKIETKKKSLSSLNSKVELELPLLVKITTAPPIIDTQYSGSAVPPTANQRLMATTKPRH